LEVQKAREAEGPEKAVEPEARECEKEAAVRDVADRDKAVLSSLPARTKLMPLRYNIC
jgi:hypothetical protein